MDEGAPLIGALSQDLPLATARVLPKELYSKNFNAILEQVGFDLLIVLDFEFLVLSTQSTPFSSSTLSRVLSAV